MSREELSECLGPDATHYTDGQLEELRIQVRQLAEVLFAMHSTEHCVDRHSRSPHARLDRAGTDRTIREN